jgi:hypothetical protein
MRRHLVRTAELDMIHSRFVRLDLGAESVFGVRHVLDHAIQSVGVGVAVRTVNRVAVRRFFAELFVVVIVRDVVGEQVGRRWLWMRRTKVSSVCKWDHKYREQAPILTSKCSSSADMDRPTDRDSAIIGRATLTRPAPFESPFLGESAADPTMEPNKVSAQTAMNRRIVKQQVFG